MLVGSRVQIAGDIEDLLAAHDRLTAPRQDRLHMPADWEVVERRGTERQMTLVVRHDGPILDPTWTVDQLDMEDLVLAYMGRQSGGPSRPAPSFVGALS